MIAIGATPGLLKFRKRQRWSRLSPQVFWWRRGINRQPYRYGKAAASAGKESCTDYIRDPESDLPIIHQDRINKGYKTVSLYDTKGQKATVFFLFFSC
jgi:hypothetical protein